MKVFVYVEGRSDAEALRALWQVWMEQCRGHGVGFEFLSLGGKGKLLKQIGHRAAEKLAGSSNDLVVALPDLYPTRDYEGTQYAHRNLKELADLQRRLVRQGLNGQGVREGEKESYLSRFYASALKHDLEMLLLAGESYLGEFLHEKGNLGKWRKPVEEQNQARPPKVVVSDIFRAKHPKRHAYRDTIHAPQILRRASDDLPSILLDKRGRDQCPVFRAMLDWVGERIAIPAYATP